MKRNIGVIAYIAFAVFCAWFMVILPAQRDTQGEQNLKMAMPKAEREFGLRGPNERAKFRYMLCNFEKKDGFQSEAEMDAAAIVLNINPGEVMDMMKDDTCKM